MLFTSFPFQSCTEADPPAIRGRGPAPLQRLAGAEVPPAAKQARGDPSPEIAPRKPYPRWRPTTPSLHSLDREDGPLVTVVTAREDRLPALELRKASPWSPCLRSAPSIRPPPASCWPRIAASRCTSVDCSSTRTRPTPAPTTPARSSRRCTRPRRSRRSSCATRTARCGPAAHWSGGRTSSSTSSTTSGTARCRTRAGSGSCWSCAGGCTPPGWPGTGRCGRCT